LLFFLFFRRRGAVFISMRRAWWGADNLAGPVTAKAAPPKKQKE